MARSPHPLSHALHADLVLLHEFGRALLPRLPQVHHREELCLAWTRELADAIIALLAARNDNPRRYVWKAKGEDILRRSMRPDRRSLRSRQQVMLFKRRH